MRHLIIGCGISGIHIALQLLDNGVKGDNILILEKSGYNCTKLFTIKENAIRDDGKHEEVILEMGPSVIHSRQEEILKLISKLGLLNTIEKVNPKEKAFYVYPRLPSDEVKKIWKELKKRVFEVEDITLTLKEASKKVLNNKEYNILKT
jgi:protoporphyrinogen oxidase